jgi:serine protease Do
MLFRPILILTAALAAVSSLLAEPTAPVSPSPTIPAAAAEAGKDVVHQLNNAFAKVFEIVAPSVTIIEITKKSDPGDADSDELFQEPPDDANPRGLPQRNVPVQSEGSGFILRADGYIVTNFHVVEGADKILVKLKDGREFEGKVAGTDEKTDIAVIKIEATDLPVVHLGDSDAVRVGEFAFAIGAPFKLDYTFTYGVISGKGRSKLFPTNGYAISDYIQTDASINPGNSGGPLCDIDGAVVGMNTLINGLNRGLGFAIPVNMIKEISGELIAGHKILRPWLGIQIQTLGENEAVRDLLKGIKQGVLVGTIVAGAPAEKSDLHPLDVITHVDGAAVTTDSQLQHEILKKKIGQTVELTVWRKGQTVKVPVKTGELPNDVSRVSNEQTAPNPLKPEDTGKMGLQVQDLTKEMADRLHLAVSKGVIVTDVAENSVAAEQDIQRGDVITEVDNKPVTNVQSFRDALTKSDPRRGILLYLDRKGNKTFAVLKAGNP